jgi:putative glutamine amidotransferase
MKKPVIGIVLDLAKDSNKYAYAPLPWYAIRKCYADAVINAGGIPIMLPYSSDVSVLLNMIDGLIIPGGDEDINPKFYGRDIISNKVKTNDIRAEFELGIVKQALKMDMPILGICNGLQVINTVFGGTLIQHIPDVVNGGINHEQPDPKNVPTHAIVIESNSLLARLAGNVKVMVNSTHHQAIETVGKGLNVCALAEDGIIEAVESTDYKFLIGVQWHCEYLNSELDHNLFKRLVEASSVVV